MAAASTSRVVIGGVGYRWMRDASFGLVAADAMMREAWPAGVRVEDLGYGALYAALDLADARPERLILVAGVERGRPKGRLYCARWAPRPLDPEDVQARIREAGAGVIDLDHLLVIAQHFGALPGDTLIVELEPVESCGGDALSAAAQERLSEARDLVRAAALAPTVALTAAPAAPLPSAIGTP